MAMIQTCDQQLWIGCAPSHLWLVCMCRQGVSEILQSTSCSLCTRQTEYVWVSTWIYSVCSATGQVCSCLCMCVLMDGWYVVMSNNNNWQGMMMNGWHVVMNDWQVMVNDLYMMNDWQLMMNDWRVLIDWQVMMNDWNVKYVNLYSASTQMPLTRSDMDHTVLPADNTISVFTCKHSPGGSTTHIRIANAWVQLTTHLSTPKGWMVDLAVLADIQQTDVMMNDWHMIMNGGWQWW